MTFAPQVIAIKCADESRHVKMKIVTWNINGIRTFKNAIKKTLDSFDAEIICVQETKVTRDLLDEKTAIVEGYNSYFSFSRGRSGYSGVATFCKDSATPFASEEGLTGLLTNNGEAVGCYGDQKEFSIEELQLLDNEGRAVITQHQIRGPDGPQTLAVVNVYCPRADPEKPERKLFKLQFYQLLQARAEALLASGCHVIVLGDINTSHRPIDHCDPDDIDNFEDNPGRKWLNGFLFGVTEEEQDVGSDHDPDSSRKPTECGGKFVDTFRFFHPSRPQAFTCWNTLTGARQTNYGTRIDYIFGNHALVETHFVEVDIMPEVEGSDHCPVWGHLGCEVVPSARCPPFCTRYMPEFVGKQQKLSRFLVKMADQKPNVVESKEAKDTTLPGSQETEEIRENLHPLGLGSSAGRKRGPDGIAESSAPKGKKSKVAKATPAKPQGSLLAFFKPKGPTAEHKPKISTELTGRSKDTAAENSNSHVGRNSDSPLVSGPNMNNPSGKGVSDQNSTVEVSGQEPDEGGAAPPVEGGASKKEACLPSFWKAVLRGPPQPPPCKVHNEPCVLRTVKKAGPTMGRQFFVCARPQGHASNPQARCNFFAWVDKGK
ncbi:DNA-(apurinic or apyrimidinic site) endonuclease 2 isoform X1 [Alosa pseudoharengus]|uniref:DNA-(apurinic or apyrimidinic site) endonuclease 2 isoform X1 n=1 Tax=Alosa pseudoharengus TaxID=34774 RepID=UPI003F88CB49